MRKEPRFDNTAARQIFDRERTRENSPRAIHVPKDTTNPIDIKLRQLALSGERPDVYEAFIGKWAYIGKDHKLYIGRIRDIFVDRTVYITTRKGENVVAPFESCLEISEREL